MTYSTKLIWTEYQCEMGFNLSEGASDFDKRLIILKAQIDIFLKRLQNGWQEDWKKTQCYPQLHVKVIQIQFALHSSVTHFHFALSSKITQQMDKHAEGQEQACVWWDSLSLRWYA